jgi:hypothetical protein
MANGDYYALRARRERAAAERQQHPAAREAHRVMAERYERLVADSSRK